MNFYLASGEKGEKVHILSTFPNLGGQGGERGKGEGTGGGERDRWEGKGTDGR